MWANIHSHPLWLLILWDSTSPEERWWFSCIDRLKELFFYFNAAEAVTSSNCKLCWLFSGLNPKGFPLGVFFFVLYIIANSQNPVIKCQKLQWECCALFLLLPMLVLFSALLLPSELPSQIVLIYSHCLFENKDFFTDMINQFCHLEHDFLNCPIYKL